ncbi:HAD family hydrolase [Pseudoalteromonas sp. T1lg65]|uniref:HAD family hydrolase n=1 Tax=Pseudoalteromonas sp. T1lg65 TaxID=2077101 RepID=UPI003F7A9751
MTECVIFDWDGTIMNSVPKIVNTIHKAAKYCGANPVTDDAAKSIIGLSLDRAVMTLFGDCPSQTQALVEAYKYIYTNEDDTETPLFEGVERLLGRLQDQGVKLAVATGKSRTGLDRLMAESGLTHYFDVTRTACEAKSKPHPDMLQQIMQLLSIRSDKAVMIGDTTIDMELAYNASMPAIGITLGVADRSVFETTSARHICDDYLSLTDVLFSQYIDTEMR